jgi:hypothetical protein
VVTLAVVLHLFQARVPAKELKLLAICALGGLAFDSLLLWTGWVSYPNGAWVAGFAPYWIVALWVLFGTTLNRSMSWLHGRAWIAAAFGAIGGPLSYLAGQKLGAMTLLQPSAALIALAIGWAVAMPLLMKLARHLDGFASVTSLGFVQSDWRDNKVISHA